DGWEQEGNQKEDVVEADPDVPYAFAQVVEKLRQPRGFAQIEGEARALRGQDAALRGAAAFEAHQPAVRWIEVKKQPVCNLDRGWRAGPAAGVEAQHRVGTVAVLVHKIVHGGQDAGFLA